MFPETIDCEQSLIFFLQNYCTQNLSTRAAKPLAARNDGVRSRRKHQDSRENKTNWFPKGPDITCFVIFLDFHFNVLQQQQKNTLKRSESKQYDSVLIRTQI